MTAVLTQGDLGRLRELAEQWRREDRRLPAADLDVLLDEIEARRAKGGDVLDVTVRGDTVPALHAEALVKASGLWGDGAELEIESTGTVGTSVISRGGTYIATVRVRCLNYEEIGK